MNHLKGLREKATHMAKSVLYPFTLLFAQLGKTGKLLSTGKRRITASILSLVMVFTILPAMPLTAFAAPTPLTFTAQADDSSVTLEYKSGDNVEYKKNNAEWTSYTKGTAITLENASDTVSFRGTNVVTDFMNHFTMSGTIAASGDVTSLTNGVGGDVALTNSCYYRMFDSCDSLTTAPALPSTTLADGCYYCMFTYCTNLIADASGLARRLVQRFVCKGSPQETRTPDNAFSVELSAASISEMRAQTVYTYSKYCHMRDAKAYISVPDICGLSQLKPKVKPIIFVA